MIVDVRRNGGGNISQMLIERFRREILSLGYSRTSEATSTYPGVVPPPHLVCLLDENSGSDGEHLPGDVQEGRPRAADRQAELGRGDRDHETAAC